MHCAKTFLLLMAVAFCNSLTFAQQRLIYAADALTANSSTGISTLTGNVVLQISGTTIFCDRATTQGNNFDGVGHVRIKTKEGMVITGESVSRRDENKLITVNRNVVLKQNDMTLTTDVLYHNQATDISSYNTGGTIVQENSTMTSLRGYYVNKTKTFHGAGNVVIQSPDYTINSDTMSNRDGLATFYGPTTIVSDGNTIYCESGWYNSTAENALFKKNAKVITSEQTMIGDSILYDMKRKFGQAYSNVVVIDTVRNFIVKSDYGETDDKNGNALFTKKAMGIMIDNNDSLFLHGDTLSMAYDTGTRKMRYLLAYHHVKFFRKDIQGACDSLAYLMQDSTMYLYKNPIVWSDVHQITGDTISLLMQNNKMHRMFVENKAFIVSGNIDTSQYNQIKGKRMLGYFNDESELTKVDVLGAAETIYYVIDESSKELIGINKANSLTLRVDISDRKIQGINFYKPTNAALYPETELLVKDRILKGFSWQTTKRPKDVGDIFRR